MTIFYNKKVSVKTDKTLGYQYFIDQEHPLACKGGKVYYHRHIASISLGRWLTPGECIHHKDGNRVNNDPENLEITTLSGHGAIHKPPLQKHPCEVCGSLTHREKYCSYKCLYIGARKVDRPSREELETLINTTPFTVIGKMFGVSDNAVRKWARRYSLI